LALFYATEVYKLLLQLLADWEQHS